eukprot:1095995-Pyramimonas_sp.AAC.1
MFLVGSPPRSHLELDMLDPSSILAPPHDMRCPDLFRTASPEVQTLSPRGGRFILSRCWTAPRPSKGPQGPTNSKQLAVL